MLFSWASSLFTDDLFNDTVSTSSYVASYSRIISELLIEDDAEGSVRGIN